MHRFLVDHTVPDAGQILTITGEEAAHAVRVKRIETGESVSVLDGAGVVASGVVESVRKGGRDGPELDLRISTRREIAEPGVQPRLDVYSATPKGGRVDDLIDSLSQIGAASWSPLVTARGVVDPRESKLARLERIAREAAKQCGRAWVLRLGTMSTIDAVVGGGTARVVVADGSGEAWSPEATAGRAVALLVGPEGGWTAEELERCRAAGAEIVRFGPHIMRIETAAVAAAAVIMAAARP